MAECFICSAILDNSAKCSACYDEVAAERNHLQEKLRLFVYLVLSQKDIDPEISKVVDEHFFDLI